MDDKFILFPNPVFNNLNIMGNQNNGQEYQVKIVDVTGRLMASLDWEHSNLLTIELEELPVGFYFVEIADGTNIIRKKFVKQAW